MVQERSVASSLRSGLGLIANGCFANSSIAASWTELPKTASGTRLIISRIATALASSVGTRINWPVAIAFSQATQAASAFSFGIPNRRTPASITQLLVEETAQI